MTIEIDGRTRTVSDRIADSIIQDAESGVLGQCDDWSTTTVSDIAALRTLGYLSHGWGSNEQIAGVLRAWAKRQAEETSRVMARLGSARSERKAAAARDNGARGGRPVGTRAGRAEAAAQLINDSNRPFRVIRPGAGWGRAQWLFEHRSTGLCTPARSIDVIGKAQALGLMD